MLMLAGGFVDVVAGSEEMFDLTQCLKGALSLDENAF